MNKSQDVSNLSQKSHALGRRGRNNTVQDQENLTATRNSPISDDNDNFLEINKLLLGIRQKSMLESADPNGDDDDGGFIDIDKLLSGMQEKSMLASADSNSGGMAEMVNNGTRGGSPTDSSLSTAGSGRDPIILSNDESTGVESETNYSDLDVDVRAKSDSDLPHVVDSELADGFGSGAALISDRLATNHQDDDSNHNNGVADKAQLCLSANRPRLASSNPESDTHQASKLQVDTDIIQESTSYDSLGVTKELEDFDASAKGNDDDNDGTCSTKGQTSSVVSDKNPAFVSNTSELQDSQPDNTQSPQLAFAAALPYQSPLKNNHLPKQRCRGATRNDRRKRPQTIAPIRLATTASAASAAPESAALEEPQPRSQTTAPDQEMVDDESTDSDDEDYVDMSNATGSKRRGRPYSRKRVRRTKDREHNDVEGPPTHPLDASCQAAAATPSGSTQESKEMPIHGYFTLKTIASKVVYCLTFSQELLLRPQHQGQRQDSTTNLEKNQSVAPNSGMCQAPLQRQKTRCPWTREEDATLRKMKKKGHSWEEIHATLPHRSRGTLQVRYSTKLKDHGRAIDTRTVTQQGSEPASDDDGSSEDEQKRSSTRKHTPWDAIDEQRLLAYKKEGKSWEWIFGKFPGRTRPAIRTRWNMVRSRDNHASPHRWRGNSSSSVCVLVP